MHVEVPNGPTLAAAPNAFGAGTVIAIGPVADRAPAELGAGRLLSAWSVSSTSAPRERVELLLSLPSSWRTSLLARWTSSSEWEALAYERTADGRARVLVDRFSSFGFVDFGTVEQAAAALVSQARRTLVTLLNPAAACPRSSSDWPVSADGAGAERLAVAGTDAGTSTLRLHLCNNRYVFLDAVSPSVASGPVLVRPRKTIDVLITRPAAGAVRVEFGVTARAVAYTWLLIGATALPGGAVGVDALSEIAPAALAELIGCASQKVAIRSLRGSQELSLGMLACLGEARVADELATAVASALQRRGQLGAAESTADYVRFGGAALRALATTKQIVELAQIAFESNLLFAHTLSAQIAGTALATFTLRGPAALVATPSPSPSPTAAPTPRPTPPPTPTAAPVSSSRPPVARIPDPPHVSYARRPSSGKVACPFNQRAIQCWTNEFTWPPLSDSTARVLIYSSYTGYSPSSEPPCGFHLEGTAQAGSTMLTLLGQPVVGYGTWCGWYASAVGSAGESVRIPVMNQRQTPFGG